MEAVWLRGARSVSRSILHISDVHFGPAHLPDRAAGVLDLVAARRPDLVILSGDLTQRAKPVQFRAARRFVDEIGVPVIVVPGNHDVPLYRFWERSLAPFRAYRRHFARELAPDLSDDELLVIGFNTAFNFTLTGGRILRRQLDAATRVFSNASPDLFKIAVIHHHLLMPPRGHAPRVLWGANRALHGLAAAGVDLVVAGHLHHSFVAQANAPVGGELPMTILHTGTTTSSRGRHDEEGENTCNWIELTRREATVSSLWWSGREDGFVRKHSFCFKRRADEQTGREGVSGV